MKGKRLLGTEWRASGILSKMERTMMVNGKTAPSVWTVLHILCERRKRTEIGKAWNGKKIIRVASQCLPYSG